MKEDSSVFAWIHGLMAALFFFFFSGKGKLGQRESFAAGGEKKKGFHFEYAKLNTCLI